MVRKLSLMLVLTLGFVPFVAQALGLGDIKPNSALNQKFNAEIKLTSVEKGEINDVKVALASDAAFKRSGVDKLFILSKLKFTPEVKPDGTPIIRVSSRDPIREPFLNFLIEVNWPKGRLVREYTVLLDPPVTLERKPAPVQAPVVRPMTPAPVPAPAPRTVVRPAQKTLVQSVHPAYSGSLDEVKVQKNSSLWVIARKHKHPGVDQHRMMMAIYYANPNAFIKNNINRLKAGAILRIPNKEDVLALEKREAQVEYKQHVQAWHADTTISRPDPGPAPEPEPVSQYLTELMQEQQKQTAEEEQKPSEMAEETPAESEAMVADEQTPEAEDELKIATARPEGEGEAGPSEDSEAGETIARLKQELMIFEEEAERARGEGEELSSRVDDLESQLEDFERLLELKSEQLANMQAALARSKEEQNFLEKSNKRLEADLARSQEEMVEAEAKPEPMVEEAKSEPVVEEEKPEPMVEEEKPEPMVEEEKPEPMVEEAESEPVVEEEKPEPMVEEAESEPVVEEEKPEPMVEEAESEPVVEEEKPEPMVKEITPEQETAPAPSDQKPAEPSLLDELMTNPTMMGIVVGVVIILLALAWILMSRKRANDTDFQESILLNTMEEEPEMLEEPTDIPSHHTEETSFLSDFSPSDIDALQDETGEVDPLSEADVYIAYGRYQQAEELIRQAIEKEPERAVLKYKLFEILYAVKNADGFIALAEESSGTPVETSDKESWEKVLSMGKKLSPETAMFAGASEMEVDDDLFSLDDDLLDEDLDENDFADLDATLTQADFGMEGEAEASEEESAASEEDDNLLSEEDLLDLSNELDENALTMEDTGVDLDDTGVDLETSVDDLGDLELESTLDEDSINSALDELEGLESPEETAVVESAVEEADDDLMLSLSDLEDESEKTVLSLTGAAEEAEDELEEGLSDISLDLGEETTSLEDELLANETVETVIDFPEQDQKEEDSLELAEELPEAPKEDPLDSLDLPDDIDIADEISSEISSDEEMQDEVKTKLDLARAYVEMGDKDGAMDILEEVMSEGDDNQKQEAQSIKDSLA